MLRIIGILVLMGLVPAAFYLFKGYEKNFYEAGAFSTSLVLTLIQIAALYLIYSQLKHQKRLTIAQFISSIMEQLAKQKEFHRKLEINLQHPDSKLDIDNADIVAFLNVFENLSALIESGVLTVEDIDQPFAYRFFLTVNNETVQDIELIRDAKFYKSIYRLHKLWSNFREKRQLPRIGAKSSLDRRCDDYIELSQPLKKTSKEKA